MKNLANFNRSGIRTNTSCESKIGQVFENSTGEKMTIIACRQAIDCDIEFEDGTIIKNVQYSNIKGGELKNPNFRSVQKTGYLGIGDFSWKNSFEAYNRWNKMMVRCYSDKYQSKKPTYKDVTVCDEWHNFQNFAGWFYENYNSENMKGWILDKDIICKNCKTYSPETCLLVPPEINSLFIGNKGKKSCLPVGIKTTQTKGVYEIRYGGKYLGREDSIEKAFNTYKNYKMSVIKKTVEKWKHVLPTSTYNRIINYEIKAND